MLVLLPPSETKRPAGSGAPLDLGALAHPSLTPLRRTVIDALVELSADPQRAVTTLRLGKTQHGDVALNAQLRASGTMPAIDRYTGVLFDALASRELDDHARSWLGANVRIHSAPFGPVGALDPIPAYRMAATVSLPGLPSPTRLWARAVGEALAAEEPDFVLDLRSEAYVSLGPVPASVEASYVRVVSEGADGAVRALNHFNKQAKGDLVRRLADSEASVGCRADLLAWAKRHGVSLRPGEREELLLIV